MIELKHFRLLAAVERYGTLSAAARALGYTQPAVSQQVQALERAVRTPLIVRNSVQTHLTEAGRVLLRHGADVLSQVSLAEAEVSALAGLRSGHVRVASFASAASTIFPAAMLDMTGRHDVRITMTEAEPPEAIEQLRKGECDVVIAYRYSSDPDFATKDLMVIPLLTEQVLVAVPPAFRTGDEVVRLASLRDADWIAGCPKCRGHLLSACAEAGFVPDITLEIDDYVALQRLAGCGLVAALVPDLMRHVVREENLWLRPYESSDRRHVYAVSTRGLARVPAVREMLDALQRSAEGFLNGDPI